MGNISMNKYNPLNWLGVLLFKIGDILNEGRRRRGNSTSKIEQLDKEYQEAIKKRNDTNR